MPRPPHWALRCLSFLVIALLLAPLASSTGMEPRCKEEMSCFLDMKCFVPGFTMDKFTSFPDDKDGCDVQVGIRPYSDQKALIRLISKSDSIKLVYEDNSEILGCETFKNGKNEKKVRFLPTESETQLLKSDASSGVACEFYWVKESPNHLFDPDKMVNIIYGKEPNGKKVEGMSKNNLMSIAISAQKCDNDWMTHDFDFDANWTYTEPDKRFSKVECAKGQDLVYGIEEDGIVKEVKEALGIECTDKPGATAGEKTYSYDIKTKDDTEEEAIGDGHTRKVACRAQACKQCTKAPPCSGSACPVPSDKDGCKVLKCPEKGQFLKVNDDKFLKENDDSKLAPTCQAHKIDSDPDEVELRWTDGDKEVTKVECVSTVQCQDVNKLDLDGANVDGLSLKCSPDKLIQIKHSNVNAVATEITCDNKSGEWSAKNATTTFPVAKSSTISCVVIPTKPGASTGASTGSMTEYVLYGVGGLALIAVIGIIIFCAITQKRKRDNKRAAAKKIPTIKETSSTQDPNLKTAIPYYHMPAATTSDPPKKAETELVEKTMIAQTPTETKAKSVTMKTAVLAPVSERDNGPQQIGEDTLRLINEDAADRKKKEKKKKEAAKEEKEASDGSEPKPIKIGKDGAIIEGDQSNAGDRSGDKSGQSEMGTTKKEEPKPKIKPVDSGPKPIVFPLNEKEEKIRKGAVRRPADYPTLDDIKSDWDSNKEREKVKKADEERKKRRTSNSRGNTVPTAVTPENPDAKASVEQTQNTKDRTRNTVDKGGDADILNLLTQMDTTFEQKEADAKKKK